MQEKTHGRPALLFGKARGGISFGCCTGMGARIL